ncbi:MAG: VirB3 family type IV secretion system protein [Caulobacteraceae bacterium]
MSGGADPKPQGYRVELHTQVSAPILIAGVPRGVAIGIGTFGGMLGVGYRQPLVGIPLALAFYAGAYALTKNDPLFFRVLKLHLYHPKYLEG